MGAPTCPACGGVLGPLNAGLVTCPTCRYIVDVKARFPLAVTPDDQDKPATVPAADQDKPATVPAADQDKPATRTTHKPAQPQPKRKGGR